MDCNQVQEKILNGDLAGSQEHIDNCQACQLYVHLNGLSVIDVKPEVTNPYAVSSVLKEYDKSKKRKDILSLIAFIFIAIILVTTVVAFVFQHALGSLKYYLAFLYSVMPLSLPILNRITRKAVL